MNKSENIVIENLRSAEGALLHNEERPSNYLFQFFLKV